jgi:DnaJ-class molecular chaperone
VCFYTVLGITRSATADEINKAYRKMSLKHHPDRAPVGAGKTAATNKMAEINQANDVLSDPEAKAYYDRTGRSRSR